MSSKKIINSNLLVSATADAMYSMQLKDLNGIPTSRNDLSNIWNVISMDLDQNKNFNYSIAFNVQQKWIRNKTFVMLVKRKLKELGISKETKALKVQKKIEFFITLEQWKILQSKLLKNLKIFKNIITKIILNSRLCIFLSS